MSTNPMKRNQYYNNNNIFSFFHEKDIALAQIELNDNIYENPPIYNIKSLNDSEIYNSNIILISSISSYDGMAQLISKSSSLDSTYFQ